MHSRIQLMLLLVKMFSMLQKKLFFLMPLKDYENPSEGSGEVMIFRQTPLFPLENKNFINCNKLHSLPHPIPSIGDGYTILLLAINSYIIYILYFIFDYEKFFGMSYDHLGIRKVSPLEILVGVFQRKNYIFPSVILLLSGLLAKVTQKSRSDY